MRLVSNINSCPVVPYVTRKCLTDFQVVVILFTMIPLLKKKCRVFLLRIFKKCARSVMVIVVGNGHGDASSNPGRE